MRWKTAVAFALTVFFAFGLIAMATVPSGNVRPASPPRAQLPAESSDSSFLTLYDVTVFDMRKWRAVHWWNRWYRASPVDMSDTLVIRRLGASTNYVAHYATSGLAIDLDCVGAPCSVVRRPASGARQDPALNEEYALTADLSSVPRGGEARLTVRGTYWNGAQSTRTSAADTYTTDDIDALQKLQLTILLPAGKPALDPKTFVAPSGQPGTGTSYAAPTGLVIADSGRTLNWTIADRTPNRHYELVWDW